MARIDIGATTRRAALASLACKEVEDENDDEDEDD